ncbi:enoyl-CoA hydratase-related protein, partial [Mycolicibacterium porcinum]|uniref:enoyl-CoA hydratase-related protein n=1 Tax=Mycolicibacterium porcinum TaxID=39693 RepID=UPI0034CD9CA8
MSDGSVTTSRADSTLRITLDRPSRRNSLSHQMIDDLVDVLTAAAYDDSLRAIALTGAGADFCTGADWVATNDSGRRPRTGDLVRRIPYTAHRVIELVSTIQLPVVCAVRASAVVLGCTLALAAALPIADREATLWPPVLHRPATPHPARPRLRPRPPRPPPRPPPPPPPHRAPRP